MLFAFVPGIALAALELRVPAWRGLDNPVMDWLGARSYSIYLVHYAIGLELVSLAKQAGSAWQPFLRLRAKRKAQPSFTPAEATNPADA